MARTIEFDPDQVLHNATRVFWQYGYCMTSISRLVEATKLNPGSIYSAFKSKEGLFLATLEYYGQQNRKMLQHCLNAALSPLEGVKSFLQELMEEMAGDSSHRGCFLVNTVLEMSPHNKAIRKTALQQLDALETLLASALQDAREQGELPQEKNPSVLAKYIMVNIWGLRVLSKAGADSEVLRQQVSELLSNLEK